MLHVAMLSKWHVHAAEYAGRLSKMEDVQITCVWDEEPARGRAWAEELGADFEENLDALLARPDVDAVCIDTPTNMHKEVMIKAAKAGKHIYTEKVMCLNVADCDEVIRAVEENHVVFTISLPQRTYPRNLFIKEAIDSGILGDITVLRCRNCHDGALAGWLPDYWYDPETTGGGAMMDLSVHTIDLMEYITGMRVTEVASMNEKIAFPEPQYDVEDTSTILMRMENGAQCVVQSNFNIPDEASKWRVEFFGTKGRLLGDTMIGQIDGGKLNAVFIDKNVAYSAEQTHADDAGIEIPGDFGNMYTREIESFSDSILNGKPLVVPASDAVHVQRIMEKAYASGEELKIMKI